MATFEDSKLRTKESRRYCHNRQVQMRSTLRSAPEMQGLQFRLVRPFGRHHVFRAGLARGRGMRASASWLAC
jgi:hypothetical protein